MSSFAKVLTRSSTVSCGDRAFKDGRGRASVETIATMRAVIVIERQEAIERGLEGAPTGEVLPAKCNPPMLMQDRFLEPLHKPVRPGVTWLRARHTDAQPGTAVGKRPLELFAVIGQHPAQAPPGLAVCRT